MEIASGFVRRAQGIFYSRRIDVCVGQLIGQIEGLAEWQADSARKIKLRDSKIVAHDAQVVLLGMQLDSAPRDINFRAGTGLKLVQGLIVERLRIFYLSFLRGDT